MTQAACETPSHSWAGFLELLSLHEKEIPAQPHSSAPRAHVQHEVQGETTERHPLGWEMFALPAAEILLVHG